MKLKPSLFPAILLLAVLATQLLPGCAPSPERSRLEQIEAIIDEHPDSAMTVLDSIDTAALRSDRDRALYGMLLTEALDKNHQNPANDSLITSAINYFADKGDSRREMIATYYGARVQYLNNDFSHAIVRFFRAKEIAEELGEHFWHGMAARGISDIFSDSYAHGESLKYAEEEFENFQKSGRQPYLNWALLDLAKSHYNYGNHEYAVKLANEIIDSAIISDSSWLRYSAYQLIGMSKIASGDYREAISLFNEICSSGYSMSVDSAYLCMALTANKNYSEASELLSKISSVEEVMFNSIIYDILKFQRNFEDANRYIEKLYHQNSDIYMKKIRTNFSNNAVDYYKSQKELTQGKAEQKKLYIALIIIISIIIILVLINFTRIALRRKQMVLNEKVLLAEQLKEALEESDRKMMISNDRLAELTPLLGESLKTRQALIDELGILLVENSVSKSGKRKIAEFVTSLINEYSSSQEQIDKLEHEADLVYEGLISQFRNDFPKLKEKDYKLFLFAILGYSSPVIAMFLGEENVTNIYYRRRHLKDKIKTSSTKNKEKYLSAIS